MRPTFIDSHTHLVHEDLAPDLDDVLRRARDEGVVGFIVPATDRASAEAAVSLAEREADVHAAVGIHPHDAAKATAEDRTRIADLAGTQRVVAIGEIGLDYHYDFSPPEVQQEYFKAQLDLASSLELPVIIHTRESMDDAIDMVRDQVEEHPDWCVDGNGGRRGVFHCFTGTVGQARAVFDLGFYVSFPGILTFKKSPVVDLLGEIGLERVLIETDAPYMAPVPMRGKRNEPAYMLHTAQKMADVTKLSIEEVSARTLGNTKHLFRLE